MAHTDAAVLPVRVGAHQSIQPRGSPSKAGTERGHVRCWSRSSDPKAAWQQPCSMPPPLRPPTRPTADVERQHARDVRVIDGAAHDGILRRVGVPDDVGTGSYSSPPVDPVAERLEQAQRLEVLGVDTGPEVERRGATDPHLRPPSRSNAHSWTASSSARPVPRRRASRATTTSFTNAMRRSPWACTHALTAPEPSGAPKTTRIVPAAGQQLVRAEVLVGQARRRGERQRGRASRAPTRPLPSTSHAPPCRRAAGCRHAACVRRGGVRQQVAPTGSGSKDGSALDFDSKDPITLTTTGIRSEFQPHGGMGDPYRVQNEARTATGRALERLDRHHDGSSPANSTTVFFTANARSTSREPR